MQDTSNTTPKYYNADIERGALNILGTRLPLPIQGKGVRMGLDRGGGLELAVGVCFRHQALTYTFNFLAPFLAPPSVVNQVAKLLYQDENLRVFESPKESESAWEQEGLIVVQMPIETVP